MRITLTLAATAAIAGCAAPLATAAPAQGGKRDPAELLARSDLNGDGRITRQEYAEARARMFDRLDRNGDGTVNSADAPQRRFARRAGGRGGGERLKSMAAMMDTNGDGRVTRSEFVEGPTPLFDRADANGDGGIDRTELAAVRQAAASRAR